MRLFFFILIVRTIFFSDTLASPRPTDVVKVGRIAVRATKGVPKTTPIPRPHPPSLPNVVTKVIPRPGVSIVASSIKTEMPNALRTLNMGAEANFAAGIGTDVAMNPGSITNVVTGKASNAFRVLRLANPETLETLKGHLTVMNVFNAAQVAFFIHAIYMGVLESNDKHKTYQIALMGHNDDVEPVKKMIERVFRILNPRTKASQLSDDLGAMAMNYRNAKEAYPDEIEAWKKNKEKWMKEKSELLEEYAHTIFGDILFAKSKYNLEKLVQENETTRLDYVIGVIKGEFNTGCKDQPPNDFCNLVQNELHL